MATLLKQREGLKLSPNLSCHDDDHKSGKFQFSISTSRPPLIFYWNSNLELLSCHRPACKSETNERCFTQNWQFLTDRIFQKLARSFFISKFYCESVVRYVSLLASTMNFLFSIYYIFSSPTLSHPQPKSSHPFLFNPEPSSS